MGGNLRYPIPRNDFDKEALWAAFVRLGVAETHTSPSSILGHQYDRRPSLLEDLRSQLYIFYYTH